MFSIIFIFDLIVTSEVILLKISKTSIMFKCFFFESEISRRRTSLKNVLFVSNSFDARLITILIWLMLTSQRESLTNHVLVSLYRQTSQRSMTENYSQFTSNKLLCVSHSHLMSPSQISSHVLLKFDDVSFVSRILCKNRFREKIKVLSKLSKQSFCHLTDRQQSLIVEDRYTLRNCSQKVYQSTQILAQIILYSRLAFVFFVLTNFFNSQFCSKLFLDSES